MEGNEALSVIKGQTTPFILGFQLEGNVAHSQALTPIPVARYDRSALGSIQMAYILAAAPSGGFPRKPTILRVATAPGTAGFRVSFGTRASTLIFLIGLDGAHTSWGGVTYRCPAAVLSNGALLQLK
jgi:hypothetical protein